MNENGPQMMLHLSKRYFMNAKILIIILNILEFYHSNLILKLEKGRIEGCLRKNGHINNYRIDLIDPQMIFHGPNVSFHFVN